MNIQQLRTQIAALQSATMDENKNFLSAYDEGMFDALTAVEALLDSLQEEPVSEELEEAAVEWFNSVKYKSDLSGTPINDFKAGAKWQLEQFEKNRLVHCEALTEEQAKIESDFVVKHLKDNNRTPTFIDAIEYGMRLHKEQMMSNTVEATIGLPYENKDGGYTHLIDVSRPLPVGNNKIAIIFKED